MNSKQNGFFALIRSITGMFRSSGVPRGTFRAPGRGRYIGHFAEDNFLTAMRKAGFLEVRRYHNQISGTIKRTSWDGPGDRKGVDFFITTNKITGTSAVIPLDLTTISDRSSEALLQKLRRAQRRENALLWPRNMSGWEFVELIENAARGDPDALDWLEEEFLHASRIYLGSARFAEPVA